MKWLPLTLLMFLLIPIVYAPTYSVGYTFSLANSNYVSMGATLSFYQTSNNGTWLGLHQSYSAKHWTRYYLRITSSSDTLVINSWFQTIDGFNQAEATLTATTATNFLVYSPNFETTGYLVTGATSWSFSGGTFTISASAGATITIRALVNETSFNDAPENVGVTITNMDVENYLFSETKYYDFCALYWDPDGYGDLAEMDIAFTDGVHVVQANYYPATGFELDSGIDEISGQAVAIVSGTTTVIDANELQVDFLIRLTRYILDADNIDIQMKCIDDSGAVDGWEYMQLGYFSIYNMGGHSTLTTSGDAGRLPGGGVFDLYAYDDSYAEATIEFKNLQHVKFMPTLDYGNTTSQSIELEYGIDYYVDGAWVQRFDIHTHFSSTLDTVDNRYVVLLTSYRIYNASEPTGFTLINDLGTAFFIEKPYDIDDVTYRTKFWFDFWFSELNGSTTMSARMNAYQYPMTNNANYLWRWLAGDNWGVKEGYAQESRSIIPIVDVDGDTISSQKIEMVRIRCHLHTLAGGNDYAQLAAHDVFDLTFGTSPLTGISTPVFDDTTIPIMPQGGFLGSLGSWFSNLFAGIRDFLGFVNVVYWAAFVYALDSIASWAGYPGLFTNLFSFLGNLWSGVVTGFSAFASMLSSFLVLSGSFLTDLVADLSTGATTWASMVTMIYDMVGGAYGVGLDVGNLIVQSQVITIIMILYPLYLLYLWDKHGFDALADHIIFMKDILAFIAGVFMRIIELFTNIISRIIESIPVAEAWIPWFLLLSIVLASLGIGGVGFGLG